MQGPTVRVQLEDFQLVLDDFVQAFFSPKSFQAVSVLPSFGSQTSRWLAGTNTAHPFQKTFSKVLFVLFFAPVQECPYDNLSVDYRKLCDKATIEKPQF